MSSFTTDTDETKLVEILVDNKDPRSTHSKDAEQLQRSTSGTDIKEETRDVEETTCANVDKEMTTITFSEREKAQLVEKYEEQIKKLKATSLVSSRREKRAKAALGKVLSGGDSNRETECMKIFNQLDEQNEQYVIEYKKEKKKNDIATEKIKSLTAEKDKLNQKLADLAHETSQNLSYKKLHDESTKKCVKEASVALENLSLVKEECKTLKKESCILSEELSQLNKKKEKMIVQIRQLRAEREIVGKLSGHGDQNETEHLRAKLDELILSQKESMTRYEQLEMNHDLVETERNFALQEAAKLTNELEQSKCTSASLQDKVKKLEEMLKEGSKLEAKEENFDSTDFDLSSIRAVEKLAAAEMEIKNLQDDIVKIEASVATYMHEREHMSMEIKKLKNDAHEREEDHEGREMTLISSGKYGKLLEEYNDLKRKYDEGAAVLMSERMEVDEEIKKLKNEVQRAKDLKIAASEKYEKLQKDFNDLKKKSDETITRTALKAAESIAGAEIQIEEKMRQKERQEEAMEQHHLIVQQLECKYEDAKLTIDEINEQKESLEANYESLCEELEHLRNENTQSLQCLAFTSGEKIATAQAQYDQAKSEIKVLKNEVTTLNNSITDLQVKLNEAKKQMEKEKKDYGECMQKCQDELSSTTEKLRVTDLQHDVVTLELHKAETCINELNTQMEKLENDLEKEKEKYSSAKENSKQALEKLLYTEKNLQEVQRDVNDAQENINRKNSEISEMNCKIQQITMESLKLSEKLNVVREESARLLSKMEEDSTNFDKKLAQTTLAAADKVANVELEKETLENELKSELQNTKNIFMKKEKDMMKKLAYAREEAENTQRQFDKHSSIALSRINTLEAERSHLEATVARRIEELDDTQEEILHLTTKIEKQNVDIEEKRLAIESLESELEALKLEENLAKKQAMKAREEVVESRKQCAEEVQRSACNLAEKVAAAEIETEEALDELEKLKLEYEDLQDEYTSSQKDADERIKKTVYEAAEKISVSEGEKIAALEKLRNREEEINRLTNDLGTLRKQFAKETQNAACAYSEKLAFAETARDTMRNELTLRQQELKSVMQELTSTREYYDSEILNVKTSSANKIAMIEQELQQTTSNLRAREAEAQEYLDRFHSAEKAHGEEINLVNCNNKEKLTLAKTEIETTKSELQTLTKQYLTVTEELRMFERQFDEKCRKAAASAAKKISISESRIEDMQRKLQNKEKKLQEMKIQMEHTKDNYEELRKTAYITAHEFAETEEERDQAIRDLERNKQALNMANRELEAFRGQYGDEMKIVAQTAAERVAHAEEGRDLLQKQLENEKNVCRLLKEELEKCKVEYDEENNVFKADNIQKATTEQHIATLEEQASYIQQLETDLENQRNESEQSGNLTQDLREKVEAGEKLLQKLQEWKNLYDKNKDTPLGPLYKNMLKGWGETVN